MRRAACLIAVCLLTFALSANADPQCTGATKEAPFAAPHTITRAGLAGYESEILTWLQGEDLAFERCLLGMRFGQGAAQQVADAHGIPFLGIRGMSDGPGDPLNLPGYPFTFFVYKQIAADNAAIVTEAFLSSWDGA